MDTSGVIQLVVLLVLLILSGFFSSAETALTTVNKVRIKTLVDENNKRAIVLMKILDQHSKMLSTILIGNNIVNISASSLTTAFVISTFGSKLIGVATGILTLLVLLFGEIVPKTWAMFNNEKLALNYANIIYVLMQILTPAIYLVDKISNIFLRLLHIDPNAKGISITENELKTYVDVSHEDGIIETEEREMIYNVFDFSDSVAKDIMIPRINMTTIDITSSYEELLTIFKESMYTRIPVYENDNDNIIGLVNIKDFLLVADKNAFKISDIMRNAYYTYEFKKTADLLIEMRKITTNVAFVLNEYGVTVGMITLEDLLEEIVGEIRDEYDEDEELFIQKIQEREYLIDGNMKLDDINNALGTSLASEDYDSIGGLIIGLLDDLPEQGEEVTTTSGIRLIAEEVNQNRIEKVHLYLPEDAIEEYSDTESDNTSDAVID